MRRLIISGMCFIYLNAHSQYRDYSHIVGSNFTYYEAVNQIQLWQEFDTAAISRDMGYAQNVGMTALRVFLHNYVFEQDPDTFLEKLETFLSIADNHGMQIIFVFLTITGTQMKGCSPLNRSREHIMDGGPKRPFSRIESRKITPSMKHM